LHNVQFRSFAVEAIDHAAAAAAAATAIYFFDLFLL
jgi:hypothetical protein